MCFADADAVCAVEQDTVLIAAPNGTRLEQTRPLDLKEQPARSAGSRDRAFEHRRDFRIEMIF